MLADFFALFVFVATLLAFADWRRGLLLVIVVGSLQDPVRKLTPGTPPLLAISALPVLAAALFGLLLHDPRALPRVERAYPALARSVRFFTLSLFPAALMVLALYGLGAWRSALLGTFGYVTPLLAMLAGFNFVRSPADLRRLLIFYVLFTSVVMTGSLLDYLGFGERWPALGTTALGAPWLRFTPGGVIRLISGLYRSPDIMGWHAATLAMAAFTLALGRARARVWLLVAVWAGFCLLICGRRKAIMMPALWAAGLLVSTLRARRPGAAGALVVMAAAVAAGLAFAGGEAAVGQEYYSYAVSIATDAPRRLSEGTFGAVWFTLVESGFLGGGIGAASQGAQHLGPGGAQGWQESGAAKLMVELGVPGFVCGLFVAWQIGRGCLLALRRSAPQAPAHYLQVGVLGMVVANAAAFIVSHQVYGDLLVMTLAALFVGVALSGPRWCTLPPGPVSAPASARAQGQARAGVGLPAPEVS
jgi:hypothetical protein